MHAVVFARGINIGRVNRTVKKTEVDKYPKALKKGEPGFGMGWRDGKGKGHASWRGTGFKDKYKHFFTVGTKYRVPGVLATSLDQKTAFNFMQRSNETKKVIWCIRVDGRGINDLRFRVKHASYVQNSQIPGEEEFLFAVSA